MKNNVKIPISEDLMLPDYVILDPVFTKTLPKSVIADTGMDVLTHAVEAYVSKKENPYTNYYAMGAMEKVFKYLLKTYEDVSVKEHRIEMQNASCMAGIAFNNASLGINHSIAHAIGAKFQLAHGKSNAIIMPFVMKYNSKVDEDVQNFAGRKYFEIAKYLGLPSKNIKEGVISLITAVDLLKEELKIPKNLKEAGVEKDVYLNTLDEIINLIETDICTVHNPRRFTKKEYKKLLLEIYEG